MKILVTGASGRIGTLLIDKLIEDGHSVNGLDIHTNKDSTSEYHLFEGSLLDRQLTEAAVEGADAIFHLGAMMSWNPADRLTMFASNVTGTQVLLQAASDAGAKRFIFASSGEVYPENAPVELPITEEHPLQPNSDYGLTKLLGEELVGFFQRTGKIETVILRFAHTQHAEELLDETSFFSGPRFFLRQRIEQQMAWGNQPNVELLRTNDPGVPAHVLSQNEDGRPFQMHITDVRDMVSGLLLALHHPAATGSVFNLGYTDPVDFGSLIPAMADITGYPVVPVRFPGPGVFYHTSNERIQRVLGYTPAWSIDRMLRDAATWRARQG